MIWRDAICTLDYGHAMLHGSTLKLHHSELVVKRWSREMLSASLPLVVCSPSVLLACDASSAYHCRVVDSSTSCRTQTPIWTPSGSQCQTASDGFIQHDQDVLPPPGIDPQCVPMGSHRSPSHLLARVASQHWVRLGLSRTSRHHGSRNSAAGRTTGRPTDKDLGRSQTRS